jgi:drug/metabolite transporter (DMT)-like permease
MAYARGADPFTILGLRLAMATAIVWAFALFTRPASLRIPRRDLVAIAVVGPLGVGIGSMFYYASLSAVDASLFVALCYTYPAMVNVGAAIFLREPLGPRRIGALVLTFAGVVLVSGLGRGGSVLISPLGVALSLTTAVAYAAYTLGIQRQLTRHPALSVNAYVLAVGTLCVLVVRPPFAWSGTLDGQMLALIALMAVFCTVIPIFLYFAGIVKVGAGPAAIISNLEPVTTILLAILLLGERLDGPQAAGVVAVLAGVLLLETDKRRAVAAGRPMDGG